MEKMTYTSVLNDVLNGVVLDSERREKIRALIGSLEKQASHKSEKTQAEKNVLKQRIADCMVDGLKYTCTEMIETFTFLRKEDGSKFSTQKVAPLLHSLESDGIIHSITIKGKNYFYKGALTEE